jgi:MFS transporter, DHA2 family, multidrug resistance protein
MAQATLTTLATPADVLQRRKVLLTCILAACARNLEPPLWIYRTPVPDAFNQASNLFGLATGLFSLGLLAIVLTAGVLGDLVGRRRVLLIGLGGLVVAHLLLPLSSAAPWFIFTRVLSGAFGALVPPLALSILYLEYIGIPETRARAIAVYVLVTSTVFLLSGSIGYLTSLAFGWRIPTALPTGVGILAFVLTLRNTRDSRANLEHRFDAFGYTGWALIVLSTLGSLVAWQGTGHYAAIGMGLAGFGLVAGIALLFWWDYSIPDESSAQRVQIKRRILVVLILFGFAMQFGFVGFVTQVRQALIQVHGYGPVMATIALAPLIIGMGAMTLYATRRLVGAEPRLLMALGVLIGGAACGITAITRAVDFYPLLAALLLVFGASMVLATTTWTALFLTAVPDGVVGVRTGINSAVFQMGGILGSLVPAALLVQYGLATFERLLLSAGVVEEQIEDALAALNTLLDPAQQELGPPAEIGARLLANYQIAYLDAYSRVLLIVMLVCLAGAALAWFGLPRLRGRVGESTSS